MAFRRHVLESGGHKRHFWIRTPTSYDTNSSLPVVLDLHGSTSNPCEELCVSGLGALADAEQVIVVAPAALGDTWNVPADRDGPDEVGFVADVLDYVETELPVDSRRLYAAGFSGGARLASLLGCVLSDRFAAVAAVAGLRHPEGCETGRTVPVIAFHGTADPINPYFGGGPPYWQTGVERALEDWRHRHGCEMSRWQRISSSVERLRCRRGREDRIVFFRIENGGHRWPGSTADIGPEFGPPCGTPFASALIWEFFRQHRLPDASASRC